MKRTPHRGAPVAVAAFAVLAALPAHPATHTPAPKKPLVRALVDVRTLCPEVRVELKYATKDNFLKRAVYSEKRCLLRAEAARMLARADALLRRDHRDLRLLVYDCARPLRVQRLMWKQVKGTPEQPYVADPARGSMHNVGCAVDLTLADARGRPLDMGTPFDAAKSLAQPRRERAERMAGRLGASQWSSRLLLRRVMVQAGFIPLAIEWWHFDCATKRAARRRYPMIP